MANKKKEKDFNYNFSVQKEPEKRMGRNSFANLPKDPIVRFFARQNCYRGGSMNAPDVGISEISGIKENGEE